MALLGGVGVFIAVAGAGDDARLLPPAGLVPYVLPLLPPHGFQLDHFQLLDGEESLHSAGWQWFEQVQMVKKSLLAPPSLYDLQFYCVSIVDHSAKSLRALKFFSFLYNSCKARPRHSPAGRWLASASG